MQEFTATLHVNHKQVKTVINAENYSDARLLIKSQYPYASNIDIKGETENSIWNLYLFIAIIGGIIFIFSPAIVLYDLVQGVQTPLAQKYESILYATLAFMFSAILFGRFYGLIGYLILCAVSSLAMLISWYFYSWDFFII